ncbi:hypothetical protein BOX15_Mlig012691g1 [Macrostomum lignano]|uniref:Ig-like domain-containing protein n=1 Tax=Macrostomum lignano TaxID=282301 RepID=A0A267FY06_9PLAT|nr:hypothetical protein BOX15_Mlig012691g1 [Macrostomum lignano]
MSQSNSYRNPSYSSLVRVDGAQKPMDGLFHPEDMVVKQPMLSREEVLNGVGQILDWVHGPGTKLLDSQRELPRNFEEAERIRKNHEQFEFKCMQALANYASLRDVRTNDNELAERLEKLEITIQDFLRRLQSRRQAVVSLYTFFRLRRDLDSYFKEIADMLVWTDNQQQHQQQRIEETEHYLRQVEKLLRFGESLYQQFCSEAERIRIVITFKEILDIVAAQLAEAKPLLAKQLEMLKIRLLETRRRLQLLVYERDASQTVAWLEDIINAVLDTYLGHCIGKTPVETQQILQQHRTLQAKSQETYDCGLEIIAALTKIYRAQGADTEGCVAMRSNLESNWRRLNEILIEMSDRYATADAFYENVDLNLERIERLILLICRDLDNGMSLEDVRETYANERDEIVKAYENTKRIGVGLMERIQFPVASLPQTVDQTMIDQVQDVIKVKLFTLWLKIRELYYYLGQMIEITEVTERWQIIRVTIDKFFERLLHWEARWQEATSLPFTIPEAESLIEEHRLANDEIGGLWSQLLKDLAELSRDPQVGSLAEQAQADAQRRMEEWQRRWERRMAELDLRLRLLLRLRDLGNEVDDKRTRLAELKTERTVTRAGPVADTVRDVAGLQRGVSDMHSKMESLFAETREKVHRDFERHIEPIEERWREYVKELELLQMFLELILRILQYLEKLDAFIEELTVELPSCRFRDEAEPWLQKIREFNRITDSFDCDWLSNAAIRLYGSSEKPRPVIERLRLIMARLLAFETSILDMEIVQRVTVTQSAPRRLLRELQDLSLPVGARCHLAVEYSSPSKSADVEWQRNGRPLHTDRLGGKWRLDEGPGYSRVTCDRVTVDDAGDIACLIRDGGSGVAMETSCRLQVLSPPSFVRELQSIRVLEGEPILLQCQVRGSPTPEVVWLKDNWPLRAGVDCDVVVDNLDGICAVKVPTADRSHAGVYKCRATSDAGEAVSVAMVEVQEFIKSRFTRPLADQSVQEGGRLQLHVDFEGEPAPEVTWFRDSQRLFESPPRLLLSTGRGNSTCTIDPLRLEDAGLYSVQLRNPGGVQKTVCNIDVRPKGEAPRCWSQLMDANVLEGSSTRLSCRISGNPPPRIVWRFNGRQLTPRPGLRINSDTYSGVHTLEIDEATKEDDGEYSLLAENPEGRVETSCRLFVESTKPVPSAPRFAGDICEELIANVSDKVTLQCTVHGHPLPTVTWFKDERKIYTNDHLIVSGMDELHSLVIPYVRLQDAGVYKIIASNSLGSAECRCTLRVNDEEQMAKRTTLVFHNTLVKEPPEFIRLFRDEMCKVGDDVILECEIHGIPEPSVWWSFNSEPILDNDKRFRKLSSGHVHSLFIKRVSDAETGRYSVTAENSSGVATCSALLVVEEPGKTGSFEKVTRQSSWGSNSNLASPFYDVSCSSGHLSQLTVGRRNSQTMQSMDVTSHFDVVNLEPMTAVSKSSFVRSGSAGSGFDSSVDLVKVSRSSTSGIGGSSGGGFGAGTSVGVIGGSSGGGFGGGSSIEVIGGSSSGGFGGGSSGGGFGASSSVGVIGGSSVGVIGGSSVGVIGGSSSGGFGSSADNVAVSRSSTTGFGGGFGGSSIGVIGSNNVGFGSSSNNSYQRTSHQTDGEVIDASSTVQLVHSRPQPYEAVVKEVRHEVSFVEPPPASASISVGGSSGGRGGSVQFKSDMDAHLDALLSRVELDGSSTSARTVSVTTSNTTSRTVQSSDYYHSQFEELSMTRFD